MLPPNLACLEQRQRNALARLIEAAIAGSDQAQSEVQEVGKERVAEVSEGRKDHSGPQKLGGGTRATVTKREALTNEHAA